MPSKLTCAICAALPCALAAAALASATIELAQQTLAPVHIEAQSVDAALRELSRQTNTNILFSPEAVQGLMAPAINATMTAEDAAKALIVGTDLEVVRDATGALVVRRRIRTRQVSSDIDVEEVIVVGVRRSLETSQQAKRDADTFVDSVTSTDIGAFPDKSVAEALQRVPGVTVSRLQSNDDSTHFSAEPASVSIRGLTFVRTEFNGRDSFSADGARGLNFNDISPELMAGVDAYKNLTAEMIEGGIAGTVNLRTRLPFDVDRRVFSLTGRANYGDRTEDTTYEGSGIYSNVWRTDLGRFGVMANYAHSHVKTQTEGVIMQRIGAFCSAGHMDANGNAIINADGSIPCSATPYGGSDWQYMPSQVNFSQVEYDRVRRGASAALQYQSDDERVTATVQYMDSQYDNAWLERSSNVSFFSLWAAPGYSPRSAFIAPATGTPDFTFGADGMLTSGILTQPTGDWLGGSTQGNINFGSAVPGLPFVNYCGPLADGSPSNCATQREGIYVGNEARNFDHSEGTRDVSANLHWRINDALLATFDAQHVEAKTDNYDILVASRTMADAQYSLNGDGTPRIKLLPGSNVNYAPGFLANPHNYFIPYIQDHYEDNEAREIALRADFEFDIRRGGQDGWLDSLKVGMRHADREQTVRYSIYNWLPVAAPFLCNGPGFNIDNTVPAPYPCGTPGRVFQGYGAGIWEVQSLGDFYDGNVFPNGPMVFANRATLADRNRHIQALSGATTNSPMQWTPLCQRENNTEGCFIDPEILDVTETTQAAYAMLRFGGEDSSIFGGIKVRGNLGVRYVRTQVTSNGGVAFPLSSWYTTVAATPCDAPLIGNSVTNISCWLSPDLLAFSNGGGASNDVSKTQDDVLPSLNLRFGLDEHQFARFGASRALSRPDFGLLRNFVGVQSPALDNSPNSPYVIYRPGAPRIPANVTGYNFVFNADSGFGALAPVTSDNFDLAYENYWGRSSSFTVGVFYKRLNGSIAFGEFQREFENNGVTQVVTVRGPRNGAGGGRLKGVEVAFQTFFDFLPGAWSGLGAQLNYTHVRQAGIDNSNLAVQPGYTAGSTVAFGGGLQVTDAVIDSHRLAGVSDDSYNIVALYEYGRLGARLAYSWRSEFLTNNLDCCIGLPMWQKASGYLDGSIRFQLGNSLEVSLDGSNLLNTTTVNQQQIFGDSVLTPGAAAVKRDSAWIRHDRRFQVGVRFKH